MPNKFSKTLKKQIGQTIVAGTSIAEAMRIYGVSKSTADRCAADARRVGAPRGAAFREPTLDEKQRILADARAGMLIQPLSTKYRRGAPVIRKVCEEGGVEVARVRGVTASPKPGAPWKVERRLSGHGSEPVSDAEAVAMVKAYEAGSPINGIRIAHHRSHETVKRVLAERGVTPAKQAARTREQAAARKAQDPALEAVAGIAAEALRAADEEAATWLVTSHRRGHDRLDVQFHADREAALADIIAAQHDGASRIRLWRSVKYQINVRLDDEPERGYKLDDAEDRQESLKFLPATPGGNGAVRP